MGEVQEKYNSDSNNRLSLTHTIMQLLLLIIIVMEKIWTSWQEQYKDLQYTNTDFLPAMGVEYPPGSHLCCQGSSDTLLWMINVFVLLQIDALDLERKKQKKIRYWNYD